MPVGARAGACERSAPPASGTSSFSTCSIGSDATARQTLCCYGRQRPPDPARILTAVRHVLVRCLLRVAPLGSLDVETAGRGLAEIELADDLTVVDDIRALYDGLFQDGVVLQEQLDGS